MKDVKIEREENHNRLLTIENKLSVNGGKGRGWDRWMMVIKEGTCYDEHWGCM